MQLKATVVRNLKSHFLTEALPGVQLREKLAKFETSQDVSLLRSFKTKTKKSKSKSNEHSKTEPTKNIEATHFKTEPTKENEQITNLAKLNPEPQNEVLPQPTLNVDHNLKTPSASPLRTSNAFPSPQSTESCDKNIPTWDELMWSFKNDGGDHPSYAMPWIPTSPGRTRLKLESDEESTDSTSSPLRTPNASSKSQSTSSPPKYPDKWEELMEEYKNSQLKIHPRYEMPWVRTSPGGTRIEPESDEGSSDSDSDESTHSPSSPPGCVDPPRQPSSPTPQPTTPSPKSKEDYQKLHDEGRRFWWSTLQHGPERCKAFFCTNVPPLVKPQHCGHTGEDLPDDFQPCDVTCKGRWCPCVRSYSGWDYWS